MRPGFRFFAPERYFLYKQQGGFMIWTIVALMIGAVLLVASARAVRRGRLTNFEKWSISSVSEIRKITNARDLVDYAGLMPLGGKAAEVLVAKAMEFKNELTCDDWLQIYDAIDDMNSPPAVTAREMLKEAPWVIS
jgi:hypothetical protein